MLRLIRPIHVLILRVVGILAPIVLVGCASSNVVKIQSLILYENLERNAQRNFAQATYAKPAAFDRSLLHEKFAPIIIHEVGEDAFDEKYLSLFLPTAVSNLTSDARLLTNAKATVYFSLGSTTISQAQYDQILYFWFYESKSTENLANPKLRGVRITVGLDGFPLVWELVTGMSASNNYDAINVVYVSYSGELAARSQYGESLVNRRHSMERIWQEASNTIVAQLVEDGPIPMGAYIYLAGEAHKISTVLCRCSPSQVDSFAEEVTYDLVPAETLDGFAWSGIGPATPLDRRLRWPTGQ